MEKSQFRKYSSIAQVAGWLLLFLIMFVVDAAYVGIEAAAIYAFNFVVMQMAVVYVHYRLVFPLFHRGEKALYFLLAFLLVVLFAALGYFYDLLFPYYYPEDKLESFWETLSYSLPISLLLVASSCAYYFVEAWFHNSRRESELRNQKLEAELNFLKSQINPHFLFNTLNNIYSYVQTGNEKSAPMLERLSSVLRFMVYDCSEEKVELNKELEAVDDLLEIYKMKNSDQQNITLTTSGVKGYHLIAPLIIVNMVENACKHSDAVSNPNGFIRVNVEVNSQGDCTCQISNSVKSQSTGYSGETKYGGVGHANVLQRLELQYGNRYQLERSEEGGIYQIKVTMPLEKKA